MIRTILILSLTFTNICLFAQDIARRQPTDNAAVEYLQAVGSRSALYYGKIQDAHMRASNHPYLADAQYAKARLSYFGVIYPEALLRMDLSRDELVVLSPEFQNIVLSPENVDFAELHGKTVIYFTRDSLLGCPATGYYMLLHSGKCKVMEKKTAVLALENNSYQYSFSFKTNYYLKKDDVYYTIRNKKGLLKILHPYKKELKQFISNANLQFRYDAPEFIRKTVSEYEKLSGSL